MSGAWAVVVCAPCCGSGYHGSDTCFLVVVVRAFVDLGVTELADSLGARCLGGWNDGELHGPSSDGEASSWDLGLVLVAGPVLPWVVL